jgi:hypothetical protein
MVLWVFPDMEEPANFILSTEVGISYIIFILVYDTYTLKTEAIGRFLWNNGKHLLDTDVS